MSDKPIGDLRRCMIADMTIRSFGEKTQRDYIRQIDAFACLLGRSSATATGDDIRRFQFAQVEQGAQPPKMNAQASALRFFFTITLGRADLAHQLARTHYPRKLPRVLTPDQVAQLIEAAPGPGVKHKTALSVAYGRRSARLRGRHAAGRRHRFPAHADPCRDGQGPQGSACHAVAPASGVAASMVPAMPVERLAVPGPGSAPANDGAPAQPRLPYGSRGSRARQLGHAAYAAHSFATHRWRAISTCG